MHVSALELHVSSRYPINRQTHTQTDYHMRLLALVHQGIISCTYVHPTKAYKQSGYASVCLHKQRCMESVHVCVCVCVCVCYWDSGSIRAIQMLKHAQMDIKQCFLNLPDLWDKGELQYDLLTSMALLSDVDIFDDNLAHSEPFYNLRVSAVPKR